MKYLLALDQGTSSSRSIVFDAHGNLIASAQSEFTQHYPQASLVEHDPEDIWATQLTTARQALAKAQASHGLKLSDLRAIGITNQRETTVVWDKATGKPIHPAIVWQDRRTADHCDGLQVAGKASMIADKTGLILDAYFSATKIAWILDHVAGARARAQNGELAFGTVDSWLLYKLTQGKVHATDVSNASRTLLFNIHTNSWDDELLSLFTVPRAMLPKVQASSGYFGDADGAFLGAAIPITGIAGDQQAALFGQACVKPGLAKNTYGTGCFMLMNTGSKALASSNGLITTSAAQLSAKPEYALEGSVFIGGAVVQWMRDGLKAIQSSTDIQALAETAPDSGGVVFVPAFTGLGAPYWNPRATGTITGLTRGSTVAHIARAALESIAFQSAALLNAMAKDAAADGTTLAELRVDGGASVNNLLMQFQADLLGIPVVRPKVIETTALGAAYLAGLATGVWKNLDELAQQWQVERRFLPSITQVQAQEKIAVWNHAVAKASLS